MTEQQQTQTPTPRPPMPVGGTVMAIVPQNFLEIQQIANQIITAGIAPSSLVQSWVPDGASDDEVTAIAKRNTSAVSTAIMAGLELGLPPLVSLRSFTVINGKPALYADGNVAVVRKAKDAEGKRIAETVDAGTELVFEYGCPYCDKKRKTEADVREHIAFAHKDSDPTEPAVEILSDRSYGWCEAKRADTGETKRVTFTIAQAKQARLWDDRLEVEREVWEAPAGGGRRQKVKRKMQNDAPWHRFWDRMLMWRATGFCLRWLFADVLGGMPDEYEARDMVTIDATAYEPPRTTPRVQGPPPAPAPEEVSQDDNEDSSETEEPPAEEPISDEEFIGNLEYWLNQAQTIDDVERTIDEMAPDERQWVNEDDASRAQTLIEDARRAFANQTAPAAPLLETGDE